MINILELMIGDMVLKNGEKHSVCSTDFVNYNDLYPIKLTDNILMECGFEKYDDMYNVKLNTYVPCFVKDNIFIQNIGDKYYLAECYNNNIESSFYEIKGFHNLQNIFRALRNETITI